MEGSIYEVIDARRREELSRDAIVVLAPSKSGCPFCNTLEVSP
jgi:hypothetical protein